MKTSPLTIITCLVVVCVTMAATSKSVKRLTVQRIAELIAPAEGAAPDAYNIEISDIGALRVSGLKPGAATKGAIEKMREHRFPSEFSPPQASSGNGTAVTPTSPTAFETIDVGWTVGLTIRPEGKLVAVSGAADYVTLESLPGGYGALAGSIYSTDGDLLTHNKIDLPRIRTTTTHFHVFAVPGEPYTITLYRGTKAEKHTFTVKAL
ncbi:MAG TPA: hypothetical protein VF585_10970 [Chthoniobacterales bacterium]|jgi:hypothetical protein